MDSLLSLQQQKSTPDLPGIARALCESGLISIFEATQLYAQALHEKTSFITTVIRAALVSPADLAHQIAKAYDLPRLDWDTINVEAVNFELLGRQICQQHHILPIRVSNQRLVVATADPSAFEVERQIKRATNYPIDWIVGEHDRLANALRISSFITPPQFSGHNVTVLESSLLSASPTHTDQRISIDSAIEDEPIVKFLQKTLEDAIYANASDLHFETYEHDFRIRFRIDGILHEVARPPIATKDRICSRIKVLAKLDIAEKRIPQDGRIQLPLTDKRIADFRVSTLPTLFGEKIVIRLLNAQSSHLDFDDLGLASEEKAHLLKAIAKPMGMVLVTGPTGSGKTITLYSCLRQLNHPGVNISTVEDPSEIYLEGVNQVNVNAKSGLDFATCLRAFLRQDPDIIMVGEIRDAQTADIAVKAAQTGHLVLSTLHTQDAPSALTRLRNMGVPGFNIAASVSLITAQRLLRQLCDHCKHPIQLSTAELQSAGLITVVDDTTWQAYRSVGCSACRQGFHGRIGIHQVMPISPQMVALVLADADVQQIRHQAHVEGVRTLRELGLFKVMQGLTTLEEVLAVTHES